MKKIILSVLVASSLVVAQETTVAVDQVQLKVDIDKAKAEKEAVEVKLKGLEAQLPQNEDLITNVKLGYLKTDGNTKTETFTLDAKAKKAWGVNTFSIMFDGQYGKDYNEVTSKYEETKNRFTTEFNYGYTLTDNLAITYLIGYKSDKFSSYNYQSYTGPGINYRALKTEHQDLDFEANILYSMDEIQDAYLADYPNFDETYASYRAKLVYGLKILENLKFDQELTYRASFEESQNYFAFSKSALSSKISDIFSVGISYKIDYSNNVAPGVEEKDTTLAAFLSLDY